MISLRLTMLTVKGISRSLNVGSSSVKLLTFASEVLRDVRKVSLGQVNIRSIAELTFLLKKDGS